MADVFDSEKRSWIMSQVPSRGTRPEKLVAAQLKSHGIRFREGNSNLPGSPDFVFPNLRIAVFVNGCFWHWHGCKRSRMPKSNTLYWERKIERNVERDKRVRSDLHRRGWHYLTIWECDIKRGIARCVHELHSKMRSSPEAFSIRKPIS